MCFIKCGCFRSRTGSLVLLLILTSIALHTLGINSDDKIRGIIEIILYALGFFAAFMVNFHSYCIVAFYMNLFDFPCRDSPNCCGQQ